LGAKLAATHAVIVGRDVQADLVIGEVGLAGRTARRGGGGGVSRTGLRLTDFR
jgi:hypothetical protein